MEPNPYDSPQADKPLAAELKPRPLFDRLLLIGAPFAAGGCMATVFDCILRENWISAVIFAAGGAWLLWYGWRWSK